MHQRPLTTKALLKDPLFRMLLMVIDAKIFTRRSTKVGSKRRVRKLLKITKSKEAWKICILDL